MQSNSKNTRLTVHSILCWLDQLAHQYDFLLADERRMIPPNILFEFSRHGLFGLQIDPKYDGLGLNFSDTAKIIEKLASINLSLATIVTTHINGTYAIANYGTDAVKTSYLCDLSKGSGLAAFALTEACAGSYVYALEATAHFQVDQTWLINGEKIWVDSGAWSSVVVTFCKASLAGLQQKFVAFAIPTDTKGVEIGQESYTMGLKAMVQNQINFKHVTVTSDKLLGQGDDGLTIANETLDRSRMLMAIKSLGASKRCLQLLISYAENRKISTGMLIDNPVTTHTIGNISLDLLALEIAAQKLIQLFDENRKIPSEILMMIKVFGSDLINYAADCALQVLGGRGYMEQNFVAQIFRDARSFKLSEGANEALNSHVGSVLAYTGEEIYEFFSDILNSSQHADTLRDLIKRLCVDYLNDLHDSDHRTAYWLFYWIGKIATVKFLICTVQLSMELEESQKTLLMPYLEFQCNELLSKISQESKSNLLFKSPKLIRRIADSQITGLARLGTKYLKVECMPDAWLMNRDQPHNNFSIMHGNIAPLQSDNLQMMNVAELVMSRFFDYGDKIAINCLDQSISYLQLLQKIDMTATLLLADNVKPGDIVGIFMDHSISLVVTLFAILKIGATYIPLDVSYPENRLKYIIDDSQLKVIVTTKKYVALLKQQIESVIIIDTNANSHATQPVAFVENKLAYIIYTSGSSGKPKGVKIRHDAVMNFLLSMQDEIAAMQEDVFLTHTTISFDIAVLEIFFPLLIGARMVMVPHELRYNRDQLLSYLNQQSISVLQATPSFWHMLFEYGWSGAPNLKAIAGGEPLYPALAKKISQISQKLWNIYGPTEATVWASIHPIEQINENAAIPIGKPLRNLSFYIIDDQHEIVKNGECGEICIAGIGLADGYVNRLDLDQQKFVQLTVNQQNVLVYKTGDVGQIVNDDLLCLGRKDRQVKYGGHRIELGEIEHVLLLHDKITAVAVMKSSDDYGVEWLTAYYTSDDQDIPDFELRGHLKNYIPDYMLPSMYIRLEKMPLTHNHKIDYHALPKSIYIENAAIQIAESDTVTVLIAIWQNLFQNRNIHQDNNFFELGGNSLLALKLISKIRDQLKYYLLISDLYQHPTVLDLANRIDSADDRSVNTHEMIPKFTIANIKEQKLSLGQERLLFIEKYENGSHVYNIPFVFKIGKNVQIDILNKSLTSIIERHEILRTLIHTDHDGNSYLLTENLNVKPLLINQTRVTDTFELHQALSQFLHQVFDFENQYPIRFHLYYNHTEQGNYLALVVHHIVFDGWSVDIFLHELKSYYQYYLALSQSKVATLDLAPLSIQYRDFALWQRMYLSGEYLAAELTYWRNQLIGFESLNLPLDYPRPQTICYHGADINFSIEAEISHQLREVAKALKVSLYSLLLSGFYLLLKGYSNQNDIVIGSPVVNRNQSQVENLIGFFVNNLALRSCISEDMRLVDYIKGIGNTIIEVQQHQDLPFEKLLDELNVSRDPSRHPVFQVMFGVQNFGNQPLILQDEILLESYVEGITTDTAKFDLMVILDDSQESITGVFNYATALWNKVSIENLIKIYCHVLTQLAKLSPSSDLIIKALSYLSEEDCQQITKIGNTDERAYPTQQTLMDLFAQQVITHPENIAVIAHDGQSYTYQALQTDSHILAKFLLKNKTKAPLIAILSEKGYNQVIASLAIIGAGYAYLPLHIDWPINRIIDVLNVGEVKTVLLSKKQYQHIKLRQQLQKTHQLMIIEEVLDDLTRNHQLVKQLATIKLPTVKETDIAYVIFTSGSTGKPKGVTISHQGVINTIQAINDEFKVSSTDKILALSELSFDLSVYDIFGLLSVGGTIVFPKQENVKDSLYWLELIDQHEITLWNTVPQLADLLIEATQFSNLSIDSLRLFLLSGDYIPLKLPDLIRNKIPHAEVISLGGATEASIWSIWYKIDQVNADWINIPYGKAMPNQKIYILNQSGNSLPIGAIGEICIGGYGVALNYWQDTQKTITSFFEHPHLGRLYRTGDYGLLTSAGYFKLIGRRDFQIKIRGYRVELGEIERTLNSYSGIKQSVVLVANHSVHSTDYQSLVGYYVAKYPLDEEAILIYLNSILPEYMVPAVLIYLDHLPLTANGKLDRSALPEPALVEKMELMDPRNPLELSICKLFAEVLSLSSQAVGIRSDFFKLGGSSILAIKFMNRLNKDYKTKFELNWIFKHRNVEQIAAHINLQNNALSQLDVISEGVL